MIQIKENILNEYLSLQIMFDHTMFDHITDFSLLLCVPFSIVSPNHIESTPVPVQLLVSGNLDAGAEKYLHYKVGVWQMERLCQKTRTLDL